MRNMTHIKSWGRATTLCLLLGALSACGDLLDVDLPHLLTDAALEGPSTAQTQVNSAIAQYECGNNVFQFVALGHEDVIESIAGIGSGNARYRSTPDTGGGCDTSSSNGNWFDQMMAVRAGISRAPERFIAAPNADGDGRGVYDQIEDNPEWASLKGTPDGNMLQAQAAIYMGAVLDHLGEFYCEIGLAPVRPAEFIVFTIGQQAKDIITEEPVS